MAETPVFAALLRASRHAAGLSQETLAQRAELSVRAIRNVESGRVAAPRQQTVSLLADALGIDGEERERFVRAARGGPPVGHVTGGGPGPVALTPVPRQLPALVRPFTGRAAQLASLRRLAGAPGPRAVLISGMPGVGKTALAVHLADEVADDFPDGQLYIDLRGDSAGAPVGAVEALGRLLRSLGVEPAAVPDDVDEAAGLYRSVTTGRALMVVLDNAATSEQVHRLLPAGRRCLALVTSRRQLETLAIRHGVDLLQLTTLAPEESVALLTAVIGPERIAAEADAAEALARICGQLPLALRIVAAKLAAHPQMPISVAVDRLAGPGGLQQMAPADDGDAVRVAFDAAFRQLDPAAQRLFVRLGRAPGADLHLTSVAAMQGTGERDAHAVLSRLTGFHLVEEHAPDRYRMHDLLRAYAVQIAPDGTDGGLHRLLDHYRDTADAASRMLVPQFLRLPRTDPAPAPAAPVADAAAALRWLEGERANLAATIAECAAFGRPELAWLIADSLRALFWHRKYYSEWRASAEAGLTHARARGARTAEAAMMLNLATLAWSRADYTTAATRYRVALGLAREADWYEGESAALANLGGVARNRGSLDDAASYYEQALARHATVGSQRGTAAVVANLASLAVDRGDLHRAVSCARQALSYYVRTEAIQAQARQLLTLGYAYLLQGRAAVAGRLLRTALRRHATVGSRDGEADCLDKLAQLALRRGRLAKAATLTREALSVSREATDHATEVDGLGTAAILALRCGRTDLAVAMSERAAALARRIGYRGGEIGAACTVVEILAARGDAATPAAAEEAARMAEADGYRLLASWARGVRRGFAVRRRSVRRNHGRDAAPRRASARVVTTGRPGWATSDRSGHTGRQTRLDRTVVRAWPAAGSARRGRPAVTAAATRSVRLRRAGSSAAPDLRFVEEWG